MLGLKLMMLDERAGQEIRCRFISDWFKIDSFVPQGGLLSEIEKINPDVVVMDLKLYARINGINTTEKIRDQFDIPVWYE
ncbi:MAG: response regulator [Planctomycetota bacterium]|jgi:CheY-like chemotaxis protein